MESVLREKFTPEVNPSKSILKKMSKLEQDLREVKLFLEQIEKALIFIADKK